MTEKTREILRFTLETEIKRDLLDYIGCHNTNSEDCFMDDLDVDGWELDEIVEKINALNDFIENGKTATRATVIETMEAMVASHNERVRTDSTYSESREKDTIVIDKWVFREN